jgi:hypothetical protein
MRFKLKRRDVIILLAGWLFACLAILGFLYLYVQRQSAGGPLPGDVARPSLEPQATYTVEYTSHTARELFAAARDRAAAWQADAQPVAVTATWNKTAVNLVGQPTIWTFRFYSPGLSRYYFVTVQADGQADGISHGERVRKAPRLLALDRWAVDSPQAINLWLNHGGSQMLLSTPGIQVVAQLSMPNTPGQVPTWTVAAYDSRDDRYHTVFINAQSGQVLQVKSGAGS